MAIDQTTNNRITRLETIITGELRDVVVTYATNENIVLPVTSDTKIDGQTLLANGRTFLLAGQTNKAENGIYTVSSYRPFAFTRLNLFINYDQINNTRVQVKDGSMDGEFLLITTSLPFTLGKTEIVVEDADPALTNLEQAVKTKADKVIDTNKVGQISVISTGGNYDGSGYSVGADLTTNPANTIPTSSAISYAIDNSIATALAGGDISGNSSISAINTEITGLKNNKADKLLNSNGTLNGTQGDILTLDTSGNYQDSGYSVGADLTTNPANTIPTSSAILSATFDGGTF
jgi:hypothetical protein